MTTSDSPPSSKDVKTVISIKAAQTSALIARINRLLSTPQGIDRTLSLLYYLSTLVSPQLARLAALTTIKLPTPVPLLVLTPTAEHLAVLSTRVKAVASKISDVRMFLRLWGLFGMYAWAQSHIAAPPTDRIVNYLVSAQIGVNTIYQILENLAYLNGLNIVGFSKKTEGKMWIWSTRCWAAHIVLEFLRLERVRYMRAKKRKRSGSKEDKEETVAWRKAWVSNAAYLPLSLHWSTEKGLISDTAIGAFGVIASGIGFRETWRKTV
ncbi:hypothetical protein EX30DRAFT_146838 [Ascodesmis nigricans]|uniref:Peroxisomal biogenesis factor 11 n=1 Tax=Ascodesmis nigricans TaxID=341454 RepID=A0A4S2N1L5_9PEZI|nr:hypothetical protein EX30DRAFT_146838 [Ascodesmis nigricans]